MRMLIALLVLCAPSARAETDRYFGYAAIECGFDDPLTAPVEDGYTHEVASFSNLNMACIDANPAVTAARILRLSRAGSDVLLNVQPALFEHVGDALRPAKSRDLLWPLVVEGIRQSGVNPDRIILYLVDEPALHYLPLSDLTAAIALVRATYPTIRTMVVDALLKPYADVPEGLTFWGFFDYFHRDPALVPAYVAKLDAASASLRVGQHLVLVMDATHFWPHAQSGLSPHDMADVAQNYANLALSRQDIGLILAYSWVGGIDGAGELGVRDMPSSVARTHRQIGLAWLGR